MEIRAYYREYLERAQRVLGDMMDFAVNTCGMEPDEYFDKFIVTGIAKQFGKGNPKYIAGMTGCELVKVVMEKSGRALEDIEDAMFVDKSPEYWSGWAVCYYQWFTGKNFEKIHNAVSMNEILGMYQTLHEADITKFVDIMNEKLKTFYTETNLKRLRVFAGLSQGELAELSGVSIRQIQMFEQGQRDINKTQVMNVVKLARVLGCEVEELVEI